MLLPGNSAEIETSIFFLLSGGNKLRQWWRIQNGLNVRETGDPDSKWPDRIKEKVGSCYYVTIITLFPYGWHHRSRIRAWGGGIRVGGGRRRRVIIMKHAKGTRSGLLLFRSESSTVRTLGRWERDVSAARWQTLLSFASLQEDTVTASASINSRGKQQELSSSPGPQHTPADVISDDPHSAALRKGDHLKGKQGRRKPL